MLPGLLGSGMKIEAKRWATGSRRLAGMVALGNGMPCGSWGVTVSGGATLMGVPRMLLALKLP